MNAAAPPPAISPDHEKHDPVTGAPHYHPVAAGTGAAAGGSLGAAVGLVGGPIGAAVGAAIGGVIGALVGKGAAEGFDEAYWRTVYPSEPYFSPAYPFEAFGPAYRYGAEAWRAHNGRPFSEVESKLATEWESIRRESDLPWDQARAAVERAYHHVGSPGDGGDGSGLPL